MTQKEINKLFPIFRLLCKKATLLFRSQRIAFFLKSLEESFRKVAQIPTGNPYWGYDVFFFQVNFMKKREI
jgi:hypothetical protein